MKTFTHGQRGTRVACPVHRLGEDRVSVIPWLDDHVDGFARTESELIDGHRLHVNTIDVHHREFQSGNAYVVEGVARTVDHAQPHALTRSEQRRPIAGGGDAVGQIGQRGGRQICEIRRIHPHLVPHLALVDRSGRAVARGVPEEVEDGRLVVVVVVALGLELGEHPHRVFVGPIREQQHVVTVGADGLGASGVDDDRPVHAREFLEAGVRVVPVGAALLNLEAVREGLAGSDAIEADARYAIHLIRQDDPVPVDGCGFTQLVGHTDCDGVTLTPTQCRCRQRAVDGRSHAWLAREVHGRFGDHQVELGALQHRGGTARRGALLGKCPERRGGQPGQDAASGQPLNKTPTRQAQWGRDYKGRTRRHGLKSSIDNLKVVFRAAFGLGRHGSTHGGHAME